MIYENKNRLITFFDPTTVWFSINGYVINTSEHFGNLDCITYYDIHIMISEVEIEMWCITIYLLYSALNDLTVSHDVLMVYEIPY